MRHLIQMQLTYLAIKDGLCNNAANGVMEAQTTYVD